MTDLIDASHSQGVEFAGPSARDLVAVEADEATEFLLDAESLWNRESISGQQYWTGLHFTHLPDESRQCIERMVASR